MGFLRQYGVSGFDFGGWSPAFDILCGYFYHLIVWLPHPYCKKPERLYLLTFVGGSGPSSSF
jgi:hypothetical protein